MLKIFKLIPWILFLPAIIVCTGIIFAAIAFPVLIACSYFDSYFTPSYAKNFIEKYPKEKIWIDTLQEVKINRRDIKHWTGTLKVKYSCSNDNVSTYIFSFDTTRNFIPKSFIPEHPHRGMKIGKTNYDDKKDYDSESCRLLWMKRYLYLQDSLKIINIQRWNDDNLVFFRNGDIIVKNISTEISNCQESWNSRSIKLNSDWTIIRNYRCK